MKCIVLAAGYATRLYPITKNFPKPLLLVGEKTVLDWLVDDIAASDAVDEFVIISNHRFFKYFDIWAKAKEQEWKAAAAPSVCSEPEGAVLPCGSAVASKKITVVDDGTLHNDTRLGAVKDIIFAVNARKIDDDCLIIAGDNLLDFSFRSFIDYAISRNASCVMRYYEPEFPKISKSGCLVIDENEKVLEMQEKPPVPKSHWCCPPFYYYKRADIARISEAIADGCGTDAPGSYVAWLCKRAAVYAFEMPGKRYDIGDVESYNRVNEEFL